MIKPVELRIGNYFYDNNNNISILNGMSPFSHTTRCDEIEGCDLLLDFYDSFHKDWHKDYECDSNLCNPIPLTEEILLKCGFESNNNFGGIGFKLGNMIIFKYYEDVMNKKSVGFEIEYCYSDDDFEDRTNIIRKIKYLHQLQNLFLALKGKELTINL